MKATNDYFRDKVMIITGASSGIGLACARLFASWGALLVLASRNIGKLNQIAEEVTDDPSRILCVKTDVSVEEDCRNMIDAAVRKFGRIDVLVNNAGGGVNIVDTVDQKREDIDQTILLNLNSVIYGSKLFGAVMKGQKDGIIINIASVCATHAWPSSKGRCA